MEADLLRYYNVDLLDLWRGKLSLRRVEVLVRCLPPGSSFGLQVGGHLYWSQETRAALTEGWRIRSTLIGLLSGKQGQQPPLPEPPEPGWQEKADEQSDLNERRFRAWQKRQERKNN